MPEAIVMKRVFVYNEDRISDPDPSMAPEEVLETLSTLRPELSCGYIKKSIPNDEGTEMVYEIDVNVGTKA